MEMKLFVVLELPTSTGYSICTTSKFSTKFFQTIHFFEQILLKMISAKNRTYNDDQACYP